MSAQFGEKIRALRTKEKLLLRQVAAVLDMDTALLSKIEKGSRAIKKEQISLIAEVLKANEEELTTLWLADQVMDVLKDEKMADEALKTVSNNFKKKRTRLT